MQLEKPGQRDLSGSSEKIITEYHHFEKLISELGKHDLNDHVITIINKEVAILNAVSVENDAFLKTLRKSKQRIISTVEKQLKIVPRNYYHNMWMALGLSAFGIPLGLIYAYALGNLAMLGVGLPIGLLLGMAYGSLLDKKAAEGNRQLDIDAPS